MQISRYSEPEFDPYGDARQTESDDGWLAPVATGPLQAVLSLPGSKSLTNRELVLAALADGPSTLHAPLWSRDSELMIDGLRALGTRIERAAGSGEFGDDLVVTPADELTGSTTIDCGLAGTVMRFLPPVAALALGPTTFDGDEYARRRPMSGVIEGLQTLGVDLADDRRGTLPFTVHGTGRVGGGELEIDASASSQFVSALLLSAARFERGLDLRHRGDRVPSLPHIEMTIATLAGHDVAVATPEPGRWVVEPGPIRAADIAIEPDLSNAAPFLIAALVAGGSVTISGWPAETTQVGARLAELLPRFGARVERAADRLTVHAPERDAAGRGIRGVELDLSEAGELVPNLVALAALADSPSTFTGIGHIRHHETDRLAALATELNGLGGRVTELDDGLHIEPAPLTGGPWRAYADHRMATTGAIIGLAVPGVVVDDIATTSKTLPQFTELWERLRA
ncbi:3-phosphoshikimate 1-carboxyvinyltransferase [Agromyces aerolatus]|uniref:3-phosphoshikimate 1-carboxyvinyltransferase n=1 Tax=Agromyces sp. LY-1074 TaxID=3074080 RepID=UPI002858202D|nr:MULTISPECIES: 3-phosphoshikimate 1-carboxyvinyltransferase [unclassified Agromyces]MDR5699823.1 3-phosphoshikimate 1-carboxyvinyltransferase [Agromyces sp. LY-1074]MDR5706365.1 3-phosphoshikimate 1-carboxyvinyltransferase [Agromyces sp. LY-1358]